MSQRIRSRLGAFALGFLAVAWCGLAMAGYTNKNDPHGTPDKHGNPDHCGCNHQQGSSNTGNPATSQATTPTKAPANASKGMPTYYISPMLISLTIEDTPLPWQPALGPAMGFTLQYNQMDIDQPATFAWSNVGPKWSFNWLSYVEDDPKHPGNKVLTYMSGGPGRPEHGFNAGNGMFAPEVESGVRLVEISSNPVVYERRFADGSKDVYAESDDAAAYPRHVFLTRRVDAQGHAVALHYDSQHRLISVVDVGGQVLTFHYDDADQPLRVTRVMDDSGRTVQLQYDAAGRLSGITDVMGMTSAFAYDGTSITAMTTPYGTTHFDTHQQGVRRWIDITDANGNALRWEFNEAVGGIPFSASHVPHGIRAFNRYLNSRDSFFWDATTLKRFGVDYTKALNYHWTHKSSGGRLSSVTADSLESIKYPLESRIWYNHPGDIAGGSGTLNVPTAVARILPDGSTQLRRNTYDGQGRLMRTIAPSGLETDYTYAPNDIDVVKIERKGSDGSDSIETFQYDDHHHVLSHTDETGATTRYTYNAQGQVLTRTDALSHVTRYTYDAQGNKTSVTDANGNVTRFAYDPLGRMTSRIDALDRTTHYQYDALNRIVRTTYPDGSYTATTWDRLDKIAVRNRDGHVTRYTYDAMRHRTSATDALGHTTRWTYYPNGLLKSRTDADGNTTTWSRDIEGRVTATINARGDAIRFVYDSADRRTQVVNALDEAMTTAFDAMNRPVRVTDPNDVITNTTYTARGWLATQAVQANGAPATTTSYAYDAHGDRIGVTDADGVKTTYAYDVDHRLSAMDDALGNTRVITRDAVGNVVAIANAAAGSTDLSYLHRFTYDAANQRTASIDADGHITRYRYDKAGHLHETVDPLGVHTFTQFDVEGHLLRNVKGVRGHHHHRGRFGQGSTDVARIEYQYDDIGRLTKVTDPDGLATIYAYDPDGRQIKQVSPDTGLTTYAYDAVGNRIRQTDARGIEKDRSYDALKRLVGVHYPSDPSQDVHYAYGQPDSTTGCTHSFPASRLTTMSDPSGNTTYCYDARGNVVAERRVISGTEYKLKYAWTPANRLASITYPSGLHVVYQRNAAGRVTAITEQGPHDNTATTVVKNIAYLPFGPITRMAYGDDGKQVLTRTYDGNYRGLSVQGLGLDLRVHRDPNGNIVALRNRKYQRHPIERYRYDTLQRLTAVIGPQGFARQHYRYNATGDRLSKITARDGLVRYDYQPGSHRLAAIHHGFGWPWNNWNSFCGWPFHHSCQHQDGTVLTDANGNQIRMPHDGAVLNLTYGANNRLVQVTTRQGQSANYLYDGHGLRAEKITAGLGKTRDFLYQGARLLAEYTSGSTDQRDYLWLDHTLIASLDTTAQGTRIHYITTDFLGVPRRVTDAQGQLIWSWPYTDNPFGERSALGSYLFNLRFPGQYRDLASGLSYNVHRDYDVDTGRYIESDPTGLNGGLNTYAYVSGNPTNRVDPFGLTEWSGTSLSWSFFFGAGATYQLMSKCQNGLAYMVEVKAKGATGAFFGAPFSYVGSSVTFTDSNSAPDPNVFNGAWSQMSGGASFPIGAGYSKTRLGNAFSTGGVGPEMGYEEGEGATVGTSSVNWSIKLDCGCGGKK